MMQQLSTYCRRGPVSRITPARKGALFDILSRLKSAQVYASVERHMEFLFLVQESQSGRWFMSCSLEHASREAGVYSQFKGFTRVAPTPRVILVNPPIKLELPLVCPNRPTINLAQPMASRNWRQSENLEQCCFCTAQWRWPNLARTKKNTHTQTNRPTAGVRVRNGSYGAMTKSKVWGYGCAVYIYQCIRSLSL